MNEIGAIIKELRSKKGWTQAQLATKINVTDKAVSKWEAGNGCPEIAMLPLLSEVFGVSIDYLFTGAERESIVLMSTMEYCAKNDDPSYLDKFQFDATDERGKDIVSYAKEYQSIKVMAQIIRTRGFESLVGRGSKKHFTYFVINDNNFNEHLYYAVLTNTVDCLIKAYKTETDFYIALGKINHEELEKPQYTRIFEMMLDSLTVTEETKQLIFPHDATLIWVDGIAEMLHIAVANKNKKVIDKIFPRIKEYNASKSKMLTELNQKYRDKTECYGRDNLTEYGKAKRDIGSLISIFEKTIICLIEQGELKQAEKYHKHNILYELKSIDGDILRVAKLRASGASEKEITIQSAIHNGILNIDEILATGDYPLIREAIEKYPIHEIEITEDISLLWKRSRCYDDYHGDQTRTVFCGSNAERISRHFKGSLPYTAKEGKERILELKEDILQETKERFNKEDIIRPLTREFFIEQLEKGNEELIIIKLCIRLEAILKGTYHYKGDLPSMLDQYCDKHEKYWNEDIEVYYDGEICSYLHKLSIVRDSIVHAENINEKMTREDIIRCVDYICNMK